MKTITFTGSIGFMITGTDHKWYRFKTDLINLPLCNHDKLNCFGKDNYLWSHGTLSWFGIMPLSWTIGINSTSTWGCWPCQKQWINQNVSFRKMNQLWCNNHPWVCHIICVHHFLWFRFTLPKSIAYGPFDIYILSMTLNYPLLSLALMFKLHQFCPWHRHLNCIKSRPQYDTKLFNNNCLHHHGCINPILDMM